MSDGMKSHIRTYWPIALGYLSTLLVAFLADKVGVQISGETAFLITGAVMSALIYSLGRWLEGRESPVLRGLGRFLLSFGADLGKPAYPPKPAPGAVHTRGGSPPI